VGREHGRGVLSQLRPDRIDVTASPPDEAGALLEGIAQTRAAIAGALERFDFRTAADSLWKVVTEANRLVSATRSIWPGK